MMRASFTSLRAVLTLALSACTSAAPPAPSANLGEPPRPTASAPAKVLTIGIQREPNSFQRSLSQGVPAVGGANQVFLVRVGQGVGTRSARVTRSGEGIGADGRAAN